MLLIEAAAVSYSLLKLNPNFRLISMFCFVPRLCIINGWLRTWIITERDIIETFIIYAALLNNFIKLYGWQPTACFPTSFARIYAKNSPEPGKKPRWMARLHARIFPTPMPTDGRWKSHLTCISSSLTTNSITPLLTHYDGWATAHPTNSLIAHDHLTLTDLELPSIFCCHPKIENACAVGFLRYSLLQLKLDDAVSDP